MITWTERYNIHHASIGRGSLELIVAWDATAPKGSPTGYTVRVGGRRLKKLYQNVEDGKAAALALARVIVMEMSRELVAP